MHAFITEAYKGKQTIKKQKKKKLKLCGAHPSMTERKLVKCSCCCCHCSGMSRLKGENKNDKVIVSHEKNDCNIDVNKDVLFCFVFWGFFYDDKVGWGGAVPHDC